MVIPWVGYSLSALLRQVEPLGSARYVEFVSQADPASMPGLRWRARLALCRGPAARRGHAPAHLGGLRPLRRSAAEPERCAAAAGGAVEIRLQERQVHRQDPPGRAAAQDLLEPGRPSEYGFYPTSTPTCRIRAGARPASAAWAKRAACSPGAARRCRSTAMRHRWPSLYAGMDLQRFYRSCPALLSGSSSPPRCTSR